MNEYESLLIEIKLKHTEQAKEYVPKLCYTLKKQDPLLGDKDVGKWVIHDLIDIWSRAAIYKNLPEEFKDEEKSKQIKEGKRQKNVRERSSTPVYLNPIELSSSGQSIPESEPPTPAPPIKLPDMSHHHELSREELELRIGKLEEQLKEQTEHYQGVLKAINDNKSKEVTESKEYQALESQIYLVQEENKELKHVEAMHIKEHPEQTFQSASSLPVQTQTKTKTETEVQFPAKEISTFFMDARNVKNVMYLQIKDNIVVGWQSDYIRNKQHVR
jgi:hypothetical protein